MLTLAGGQVESLWDVVLAIEARELPDDLARLDQVWATRCCWRRALWRGSARRGIGPAVDLARLTHIPSVGTSDG